MALTKQTDATDCDLFASYGQCCCLCKHLYELHGHPDVGSKISDITGYVCTVLMPPEMGNVVIDHSNGKHSIGCEAFDCEGDENNEIA